MTQLSRFLGICACLFYLEHGVPHVHFYAGKPSRSKRLALVLRIRDNKIIGEGRSFPKNRFPQPGRFGRRVETDEPR